ncbi:amidase family protein [Curtobacterium flaccumfaciens pv. flaccumfaciens]|uniref:amidase family protein n=1 Tax=Curtobacterium flaccumfaciens TaxID=2035 RepID=UPI003993D4E0
MTATKQAASKQAATKHAATKRASSKKRTTVAGASLIALVGTVLAATPAITAAAAPAAVDASPAAMLAPYYTDLDLTGDDQVTKADLAVLTDHLGATTASTGWATVSAADTDADGTITVADLAGLSQRMIYDDGPFQLVEASTIDMQAAMNAGVTTSVAITEDYLDRIAAYDRTTVDTASTGRALNSIVTTNADALAAAKTADAERAEHGMTSMLLGVPIAVKDNYDTKDMPTTGGCGCWDDNQTDTDAAMVTGLRDAGAVILAKASLDEFAFGFVSEFSSNQPAGSSLLVASPYNTAQTAGGSSGGTGAAISANLAGIGFGTDTGGSIRVPSTYNQLVGIRPTVGLTSRDGIIPLALSQDTGGPITRSVTDAAVALDAVTGVDAADPATSAQAGKVPTSYTSSLDADSLQGARIGYVTSMVGTNATTKRLFDASVAKLEAAGATVVPITATTAFNRVLSEGSGSTNEFKHDLDEYVAKHLDPDVTARSLQGILASGEYVPSRKSTYQSRDLITDTQYQAWAGPTGSHTTQLATGKQLVTQMLDDQDLDALVYPSGTPYGTQSTNMRLSPNTGMPAITVPMGQATAADNTITGAGVNLEFLGRSFDESTVIGLGYAFEQETHARTTPALYPALG